jgi:asparagine synthase (glutamine-hydrolysing)
VSVQFGTWNFQGQPPAPDYVERVSAALAPFGPDSNECYAKDGIEILYRAFHTTKESHRETQPHISASGAVITWDGRLDNRGELISELRTAVDMSSTDVAIVAAAYEKWGANCFVKLIGDWALSVWNPSNRSLILAKDPIGTRHLYYSIREDHITWSTILDPLVLFAGKTFAINEEYIAGWFAIIFPAAHLTPYVGIDAVPPSSFVLLRPGKRTISKYWDFDPGKKIRYRTDAEYEEHFRTVFAKAVQRRLRSDRPILAELSGGMDSSSIVCMADTLIARGGAEMPRLDTVSWYDDSDPTWGERPYFTKVEEKRNRTGYHIDFGAPEQREEVYSQEEDAAQSSLLSEFENDLFAATPVSNNGISKPFKQYETYIQSEGYRITLSGIGGEEATGGGMPTPIPELQDLVARARLFTLVQQLNAWAMKMRKPRLPLLWEVVRGFFFRLPVGVPQAVYPTVGLNPSFVSNNSTALHCYPSKIKLFGALPSLQFHIHELNQARRFLAYCSLHSGQLREIRYPYLDCDLLEFTFAVPQGKLIRVGQRRSLMRRALVGIVSDELLNRKRRTASPQSPRKDTSPRWPTPAEMGQHIVSGSLRIIDEKSLLGMLLKAQCKEEVPVGSLMRTLKLEAWLRHLAIHGVLANSVSARKPRIAYLLKASDAKSTVQYKRSVS